jgi:hypothetical protein
MEPREEIEAVRGRVAIRRTAARNVRPAESETRVLPAAGRGDPRGETLDGFWAFGCILGLAVLAISRDAWAALAVGLGVVALRRLSIALANARATFAQGFLPYSTAEPMPQGLQEDDDFSFRWTRPELEQSR